MINITFNKKKELLNFLTANNYSTTIFWDKPDYVTSIIGISDKGRIVYDFEKMIEILMKEQKIEYTEALEWFDVNIPTIPNSPILLSDAPLESIDDTSWIELLHNPKAYIGRDEISTSFVFDSKYMKIGEMTKLRGYFKDKEETFIVV